MSNFDLVFILKLNIFDSQLGGSGGSVQSGVEGGTALVFFIGGCTYSEIAALRFLSSRVDQGKV